MFRLFPLAVFMIACGPAVDDAETMVATPTSVEVATPAPQVVQIPDPSGFRGLVNELVVDYAAKRYVDRLASDGFIDDREAIDVATLTREVVQDVYVLSVDPTLAGRDLQARAHELSPAVNRVLHQHLAQPEALRDAFRRFAPMGLAWVVRSGMRETVLRLLDDRVIPVFELQASAELVEAHKLLGEAEQHRNRCWRSDDAECDSVLDTHATAEERMRALTDQAGITDHHMIRFRLRRQAEGGQPLVDAYADLARRTRHFLE